jgi:uncharacterized protein
MKCPVCNTVDLLMTERQGVEIDYCPQCRGIWLDRGELDKIIERSASLAPAPPPPSSVSSSPPPMRDPRYAEDPRRYGHEKHHGDHDDHDDHDYNRGYDNSDYNKKRKKSFLGDLFDFGGD